MTLLKIKNMKNYRCIYIFGFVFIFEGAFLLSFLPSNMNFKRSYKVFDIICFGA